jgi:hypothetical protein
MNKNKGEMGLAQRMLLSLMMGIDGSDELFYFDLVCVYSSVFLLRVREISVSMEPSHYTLVVLDLVCSRLLVCEYLVVDC